MEQPDRKGDLSDRVGGLVDRHGDEVADEMIKTTRFVRRFSVAVLAMVALGFVAFVLVLILIASKL